jgi:hypothetical protein
MTTNKNARIVSRVARNGEMRTETVRRDPGEFNVSVSTDQRMDSTRLFLDLEGRFEGAALELTGAQARTLYLTLQRHFQNVGKNW